LKWTTTCESKYENFPKPSSRKLEPVNWVYEEKKEEEEEKRNTIKFMFDQWTSKLNTINDYTNKGKR
jgi:hypothetical protein